MKAFITKYALTQGIVEVDNAVISDISPSTLKVENLSTFSVFDLFHGEGVEWHRTRESALDKADKMRVKKIISLKKQISKLESMKF